MLEPVEHVTLCTNNMSSSYGYMYVYDLSEPGRYYNETNAGPDVRRPELANEVEPADNRS